jgi:hypothetical protein
MSFAFVGKDLPIGIGQSILFTVQPIMLRPISTVREQWVCLHKANGVMEYWSIGFRKEKEILLFNTLLKHVGSIAFIQDVTLLHPSGIPIRR